MASCRSSYSDPTHQNASNSGGGGVCMMSSKWRDEQHPSFINFISSFLTANSFRLNFVLIAPDLIFNCGGLSVSFVFVTNWDCNDNARVFNRVKKLKEQFAHLYVVVTLPTREQNESFVRSYFKYGMQLGRPTFVPVQDIEMGFEKIVKIAHCRGAEKAEMVIRCLKNHQQIIYGISMFILFSGGILYISKYHAPKLKRLILSYSLHLIGIPDLSNSPSSQQPSNLTKLEHICSTISLSNILADEMPEWFRNQVELPPHSCAISKPIMENQLNLMAL
ncbi:hypothetical protein JRO89_XS07G0278100 [Xanthoceras sorbifolium]|uniref:Protein PARTING DANCERS-like n=1 Tax=Xanthoceras sorbifolium TaxID=99658 RepID=A0ABQ8HVF8_9ROSI|nr:hypothetical protein JRO89_XS07G0278100 [Xanthoceras sorbifolium]